MTDSELKLNTDKTEILVIGILRIKLDIFTTCILSQNSTEATSVRTLVMVIKSTLDNIFMKCVVAVSIISAIFVAFDHWYISLFQQQKTIAATNFC